MRLSQIHFSTSEYGEQELADSLTNSLYCFKQVALHPSSSISLIILEIEKICDLHFLWCKPAQWKLPFFV